VAILDDKSSSLPLDIPNEYVHHQGPQKMWKLRETLLIHYLLQEQFLQTDTGLFL